MMNVSKLLELIADDELGCFPPDVLRPPTPEERENLRMLTSRESPEVRETRLAPIRLEAQRQKARLSSIPFHAHKATRFGEEYWMRLAASYQGT